jgi:hypothetical protein
MRARGARCYDAGVESVPQRNVVRGGARSEANRPKPCGGFEVTWLGWVGGECKADPAQADLQWCRGKKEARWQCDGIIDRLTFVSSLMLCHDQYGF